MTRIARTIVRPAAILAVVVAVFATACSDGTTSSEPGDAIATSVIDAVDATIGTSVVPTPGTLPEGCRRERVEDEYGFVEDIVVCDGEPEPEPEPEPVVDVGFIGWAGSPEAEAVAVPVRDALVLSGGCADDDTIRALEVAVATVPSEVRAPLEVVAVEIAQAAAFCTSDPAQWESHLRSAIAALQEFVLLADEIRVSALREASDD